MNLFHNVASNYNFFREDFVGLSVNFSGVGDFFLHILIAAAIFIIFYLFGEKLRKLFFKENKKYNFFVSIALGYIVTGTGIGLLGAFSLLQKEVIWGYLIVILLVASYRFPLVKVFKVIFRKKSIKNWIPGLPPGMTKVVVWGVILFVSIAFLRLMTPEITEDGYHTDLPRFYFATQTSIHETRELLHVIPYPQLAEMVYLIPLFLGDKEAVRFIHFGFYLLIILLLFAIAKQKESSFANLAPLLFVTAPIMVRYSSSQYVDFFMVFSFLLSLIILQKNASEKIIILSGIIFGSVLSIKMWTLIYMPVVIIYLILLNRQLKVLDVLRLVMIFVTAVLSVPLVWYIRAFIITGNPIYPIFSKLEYLEISNNLAPVAANYFGFNWNMFAFENMVVYSPLFFLGVIFFIFSYRQVIKRVKKLSLFMFFILLMSEQLIVRVDLGRYLIAWYTIAIVIVSAGVSVVLHKNIVTRFVFILIYLVLFLYYFLNTMCMLPYGFGWSDKNAYLTRVLGRDNASYYDFDHLFNKWISNKDLVATDGIVNFYYADFQYIDIGYIFTKDRRSFDLLRQKGVTKLLVKGGDIEWFCKRLALTQCDRDKVKLLATWPADTRKYNLYELK